MLAGVDKWAQLECLQRDSYLAGSVTKCGSLSV